MNVIASFGLKVTDLYKLSFTEFLNKKPENKKLKKELQLQKYNLYEEERQNNIKKCISKRRELVKSNNNKTKNKTNSKSNIKNKLFTNGKKKLDISNDDISNTICKSIKKYKKPFFTDNNGVLYENNTYIMNHYEGINSSVKKDELDKITSLNLEKYKIERNKENSEQFLANFLKSEIIKENQIRKVKEKINKKEEKINEFIHDRKENIKFLENERYKDFKDRNEKQKLYDKIMLNFGHKIHMSDRKINSINLESQHRKLNNREKNKTEELKEQISNYEKRNEDYKKKISQIFDLNETDKIKVTLPKGYDNKPPDERQKKILEIEDKYEMEIIKRENVFLNRLNIMQNKINDYMEKLCENNNSFGPNYDRKCRILMKNEFLMKRVLMTTAKKNYASLIAVQEGNLVPEDNQLAITGIEALAKSTKAISTRKALKNILLDCVLGRLGILVIVIVILRD